jgi:hypothetical protein
MKRQILMQSFWQHGGAMRKNIISYDSIIDALVAVSKRLGSFEERHLMVSEDFYYKFKKGQVDDDIDFIEWSNDYQHYLAIRLELEKQLENVA